MEKLSKSIVMRKINDAVDMGECLDFECLLGKTGTVLHVKMDLKEREVFVDEHGVRWVRE